MESKEYGVLMWFSELRRRIERSSRNNLSHNPSSSNLSVSRRSRAERIKERISGSRGASVEHNLVRSTSEGSSPIAIRMRNPSETYGTLTPSRRGSPEKL